MLSLVASFQFGRLGQRANSKIRHLFMAPESTTGDAKRSGNAGDEDLALCYDPSHVGERIIGDVEDYARQTMTKLKSPESVNCC